MTAVEQAEWAVGDPVWYRVYGSAPSPAEVVAVLPGMVDLTVQGMSGIFTAFPSELTRREL